MSVNVAGNISDATGSGIDNVVVNFVAVTPSSSSLMASATTNAGNFVASVPDGSYVLTPVLAGYVFTPANCVVTVAGIPTGGNNFVAAPINYGRVLQQLLPEGMPWLAAPGSNFGNLLDGLGTRFDAFKQSADSLLQEFDPRTTLALLPDWEVTYGLPGTNPNPPQTIPDRRAALWAAQVSGQTPTTTFFILLALSVGYTVTITSNAFPPMVANSLCNAVLNPWGGAFAWIVNCHHGARDAYFQWLIQQFCPAHTSVSFVYT
jgi:uncharacterized protein YmfQ (DUF2313 family)